jgi:hypothetical protein
LVLFVRGVVLIAEDYCRPEVGRGWNTLGLVIALVLASASGFEAYRFLNFFFTERRARRAFRHFN